MATIFVVFIGLATARSQNWTSNSIAFSPFSFSMSADGSVILLGAYYDGGYVSTNSGATWTNTPQTLYVGAPACSADGKKLFIIVKDFNTRLTCSTNFGLSWFTVTTNVPLVSFIASSADGNILVGGGNSGLFTSTNAGADWITNFSGSWYSAASSADGRRWIASAVNTSVGIVTSTNCGVNWTSNSVSRNQVWTSVASSVDGNILIATTTSYIPPLLFVSTNGGGNWTSNSLPEPYNSPRLAASADMHKLVVWLTSLGHVYTSSDLGATWVSNSVPNDYWLQVASTADGNKLVAFQDDSIWVKSETNPPRINLDHLNDTLNISWLVPSTNLVLEETLDLNSTNWTTLTNVPSLDFSNLDYKLSITPSHSSAYFRLAPK